MQGAVGTRPLLSIGMTSMPRQSWKWIDFIVTDLPCTGHNHIFSFPCAQCKRKVGIYGVGFYLEAMKLQQIVRTLSHIFMLGCICACLPMQTPRCLQGLHMTVCLYECTHTSTHSMKYSFHLSNQQLLSVVVLLNQGDMSDESYKIMRNHMSI